MNHRDYKEFSPGQFYHVYNRGNGKMNLFRDDEDFNFFISRLRETLSQNVNTDSPRLYNRVTKYNIQRKYPDRYIRAGLPKDAFSVINYCLMPNHFHLLIKQNSEVPISKLISKVCTGFSIYFNKKYDHVGSVFQDRFKAVLVDNDEYLMWLSAYIHQNPAMAGLVRDLKDYPYSSYLDYMGVTGRGIICETNLILGMLNNDRREYERVVRGSLKVLKEKKELDHLLLGD